PRADGGVRRAGCAVDRAVGVDVPSGADEVEHHWAQSVRREHEGLCPLCRIPLFLGAVRAKPRATGGLERVVAMMDRECFLIEHRRTWLGAGDADGAVTE